MRILLLDIVVRCLMMTRSLECATATQCFDTMLRRNASTQCFDKIQQSAGIILVMASYGAEFYLHSRCEYMRADMLTIWRCVSPFHEQFPL